MDRANTSEGVQLDNRTLPLVRRLMRENFRDHASQYGIALIFMVIVAATTAATAWIMRDVVETLFIEQNFQKTIAVGFFVVGLFVVKGLASYGQIVCVARVGNAIVAKLQMRLFNKVLQQGAGFYDRYPSNDLITRIGQNAQAARSVIELIVTSLGRDLLTLVGLLIVMIVQDPALTFWALVFAPPVIYGVSTLVRRVRKAAKQHFDSNSRVVQVMQETVGGISIVKAFSMEPVMRDKMTDAVHSVESRVNRIASLGARTSPLMETLGGLCMGIVIIYAGWSTTHTGRSPAEFIAFLTAFLLAYDPAKRIARLHINLEAGLVGARLMYEVLDEPVAIESRVAAKALDVTNGDISFEGVDFSYPARETQGGETTDDHRDALPVLRGVDLFAKGGCTTALVGPSGAGKSTLVSLILRFYDVKHGAIRIDGQDLRDVSLETLRQNIAYVSQDTVLFSGTVSENIAAGSAQFRQDAIEEAAKIANAHEFIEELPDGYNTILSQNGINLSGGQRQRIAIARAVYKDAPIVLLDEATSSLDNESETLIHAAFDELVKGRTTIVIAHRLSTVQNADMIHVLKDGEVVESGRHQELLNHGQIYRHLHDLQFRGTDEDAAE